jgi:hypothetical protein
MIIFFNKQTGEIIGTIEGRLHDAKVVENALIQPSNVDKDKICKYIVPFKPVYKDGIANGLEPDTPDKNLILDFESGKKSIYDYKVSLEKGQMTGFIEK